MTHNPNYTSGSGQDHIHGQNGLNTSSIGRPSMGNDLGRATYDYRQRTNQAFGNLPSSSYYSNNHNFKLSNIISGAVFLILFAEFLLLSYIGSHVTYNILQAKTTLTHGLSLSFSIALFFGLFILIQAPLMHRPFLWLLYSIGFISSLTFLLYNPQYLTYIPPLITQTLPKHPPTIPQLTLIAGSLSFIHLWAAAKVKKGQF